jgi:hypothetical protein
VNPKELADKLEALDVDAFASLLQLDYSQTMRLGKPKS